MSFPPSCHGNIESSFTVSAAKPVCGSHFKMYCPSLTDTGIWLTCRYKPRAQASDVVSIYGDLIRSEDSHHDGFRLEILLPAYGAFPILAVVHISGGFAQPLPGSPPRDHVPRPRGLALGCLDNLASVLPATTAAHVTSRHHYVRFQWQVVGSCKELGTQLGYLHYRFRTRTLAVLSYGSGPSAGIGALALPAGAER
jgi:hypothetical protein